MIAIQEGAVAHDARLVASLLVGARRAYDPARRRPAEPEVAGEPARQARPPRRPSAGHASSAAMEVMPLSGRPQGIISSNQRRSNVHVEREAVGGDAALDPHADRGELPPPSIQTPGWP